MRFLKFITIVCMTSLLFPLSVRSQNSLLHEEFENPDFSTPKNINKHTLNFFHHSVGKNLLRRGLQDGLEALGYNLHSCIMTTYEYENYYTDYRHWYKRFQRELGIKVNGHYYRYEGPDHNGNPIIGEQIDDDYQDFMLNYYEFNAELMDIIIFKPCYPNSEISNNDTKYDENNNNNGYGKVIGGTPYSDNGTNNFMYLNSTSSVDEVYTNEYWDAGEWRKAASSLAQIKCGFRGMLNIFVEHPDILFIAMQGPPKAVLTDDMAKNCRELARWMREDWLHQFDPTGTDKFTDYPGKNVVPFDFQNSVGWTGDDPLLDNEYFWFVQGGFPDNSLDTADSSLIGRGASGMDHPYHWLNYRTSAIICGGTDTYSNPYTGQESRTYDCWINAVVNRWEQPGPIKITIADTSAFPGDSINIPIHISDLTELNISSIQFQVKCDTTILKPVGVHTKGLLTEQWGEPNFTFSDSGMIVDLSGESPLSGKGNLCLINFLVNQNAKSNDSSFITLNNFSIIDSSSNISFTPGKFFVKERPIIEISIADTSASPGDSINIPIRISDLTDLNISSIQFGVSCDTAIIMPLGAHTKGSLSEQWGVPNFTVYESGMTVNLTGESPLSGQGNLCLINFLVNQNAKPNDSTFIILNNFSHFDNRAIISFSPGKFFVKERPIIEISIADTSGSPGDSVDIPVRVSDVTNLGVSTIYLDISCNTDILQPLKVFNHGTLTKVWSQPTFSISDTGLTINLIGESKLTGEGDFVIIRFLVMENENLPDSVKIGFREVKLNQDISPLIITQPGNFQINRSSDTEFIESDKHFSLEKILLHPNYPNPFNSSTLISYNLPLNCHVELKIYNMNGQVICKLVDEFQQAGYHEVVWNGVDEKGRQVSSGIYYYCSKISDIIKFKKMILMK